MPSPAFRPHPLPRKEIKVWCIRNQLEGCTLIFIFISLSVDGIFKLVIGGIYNVVHLLTWLAGYTKQALGLLRKPNIFKEENGDMITVGVWEPDRRVQMSNFKNPWVVMLKILPLYWSRNWLAPLTSSTPPISLAGLPPDGTMLGFSCYHIVASQVNKGHPSGSVARVDTCCLPCWLYTLWRQT